MSRIDPDGVRVRWHRTGEDEQVLVGFDGEDVRIAVAFSPDAERGDLRAVIDARDRELQHYFESLARCRSSSMSCRQRSHE